MILGRSALSTLRSILGSLFPLASAGAGTATLGLCHATTASLTARRRTLVMVSERTVVSLSSPRGAKALCP